MASNTTFNLDIGGVKVVAITWLIVLIIIGLFACFPVVFGTIILVVLGMIIIGMITVFTYIIYIDHKDGIF